MEISFSWQRTAGRLTPNCQSSIVNKDGVSPLACLLTDDGGQHYLSTIPWLDIGIDRVNSIRNNEIATSDWDRDAWGAEINSNEVKIFSLYDETYFELVGINAFEKALSAWREFIQLEPAIGLVKTNEI